MVSVDVLIGFGKAMNTAAIQKGRKSLPATCREDRTTNQDQAEFIAFHSNKPDAPALSNEPVILSLLPTAAPKD